MNILTRRNLTIAGGALVALVIVGALTFEWGTRDLVARQGLCTFCHVATEYVYSVRLSESVAHPPKSESEGGSDTKARCVQCHLPPGLFASVFAYSHFLSITDLYGHFRDRATERAGPWLPARQAAAYRVRDKLFENDSPTCRSCHVEAEIKPARERGVNAHKKALEEKLTCIECHTNETHRMVELREAAFKRPESSEDGGS